MVTSIAAGDWNLGPGEVQALATQCGARFAAGFGVDNAIYDNATLISVRSLGKRGSDHPAVLYTFTIANGEWFRLLAWNVYVGRHPQDVQVALAQLIDETAPHAVALSEAYRCREVLGKIPGYRRIQGVIPFAENRDCALLIREDSVIRHKGLLRMREQWIGPKHGLPKGARRYPRAYVRTKSGAVVRLLSIHLPFGEKPVAESKSRIVAWFKN